MKMKKITPWQRFIGLLELDKRDIRQVFYYAIFSGLVALSLPLGIQAIINLIQGALISTSWIVLVIVVTMGSFSRCIAINANTNFRKYSAKDFYTLLF